MDLTARKWQESCSLAVDIIAAVKRILHGSELPPDDISVSLRRLRDCVALLSTFDLDANRKLLFRSFLQTYNDVLSSSLCGSRGAPSQCTSLSVENNVSGTVAAAADLGPLAGSIHPPGSINTRWTDVCGAVSAVASLKQAVILPQTCPHLFTAARRPWKCILLYGPPGTGKTMLAAAAAAEASCTFISVSSSDLLSKWVGDSEKLIRELFAVAIKFERCIIFLDEIDSLCSARGTEGESEAARRIKTEFLIRIQAIVAVPHVTVIAATNLPWALDSAFRRRFDRFVYVGLPAAEDREKLIRKLLDGVPHVLSDETLRTLSGQLDGYSGSDISHIVHHAVMNPMHALESAEYFRLRHDQDGEHFVPCCVDEEGAVPLSLERIPPSHFRTPLVSETDFAVAINSFPRSSSPQELAQFAQWERDNR